jgi:hypothetical protein
MATGSWNSLRLPRCRMWLNSGLESVRRITKATFAHRTKRLQRGILLSIGFVLFVVASLLWRTVLMLGIAVVLALILQELPIHPRCSGQSLGKWWGLFLAETSA